MVIQKCSKSAPPLTQAVIAHFQKSHKEKLVVMRTKNFYDF
jgi:hypothetical protein